MSFSPYKEKTRDDIYQSLQPISDEHSQDTYSHLDLRSSLNSLQFPKTNHEEAQPKTPKSKSLHVSKASLMQSLQSELNKKFDKMPAQNSNEYDFAEDSSSKNNFVSPEKFQSGSLHSSNSYNLSSDLKLEMKNRIERPSIEIVDEYQFAEENESQNKNFAMDTYSRLNRNSMRSIQSFEPEKTELEPPKTELRPRKPPRRNKSLAKLPAENDDVYLAKNDDAYSFAEEPDLQTPFIGMCVYSTKDWWKNVN